MSPPAGQNIQKSMVSHTFRLKNHQKYFIRYTPKMFLRNALILKFLLLKALWSYTRSKFLESYTPPDIQIRVKATKQSERFLPVLGA